MKILFYSEGGRLPADEFLRSLPATIEARFRYYLKHLQGTRGIMQGVSFKKLLGYPMEEIRVKESKNLHRLKNRRFDHCSAWFYQEGGEVHPAEGT